MFIWREVGQARRVTLRSKKGDPARLIQKFSYIELGMPVLLIMWNAYEIMRHSLTCNPAKV